MTQTKFLLMALVSSLANAACTVWTGSHNLIGSTTEANVLDHYSTSYSNRVNGEECSWDITCPTGSFIGATDLQLMMYSGDSLMLSDADTSSHSVLDTMNTGTSWIPSGATRSGRKVLYPNVNKLRIHYNTSTSGSVGYGFQLTYKCFTTKCPSDLVTVKTYSAASKSGFEFHNAPVAGTECSFTFACAATTDRPRLNYMRGSSATEAAMTIAGTAPASSFSVPMNSSTNKNYQLEAATSYTVTYATNTSISTSDGGYSTFGVYASDFVTVSAACQSPSETTCLSGMVRNGATLSDGYGTITSDPDGWSTTYTSVISACEYQVTCPSTASGILFTGAMDYRSSAYSSLYIRANSGGVYSMKFTTYPSAYAHSSTSAYVYMASSTSTRVYGGYVTYSCTYSQCYSSSQAGLHLQTVSLSATTLQSNTGIPQTTQTQTFNSDADGPSSSNRITSSDSGQSCQFTATCPTGYYVMLNISGRVVGGAGSMTDGDRIYATGGGKTYDFSFPSSSYSSTLNSASWSQITSANNLTWSQSAHYSYSYGYGYSVTAGCTSFVEGGCPLKSNHFDALANGTSSVALDTYVYSSSSYTVPTGYKCDFPITCPSGKYVEVTVGNGLLSTGDNPNAPTFKDSNGNVFNLSSTTSSAQSLGVNSATLTWETKQWNVTINTYRRGFYLTVFCSTSSGGSNAVPTVAATPAPTPALPPSPAPLTTPVPTPQPTAAPPTPSSQLYTELQGKEKELLSLSNSAMAYFQSRCQYLSSTKTCSVPACGNTFKSSDGFDCITGYGTSGSCGGSCPGMTRSLSKSTVWIPAKTDFTSPDPQAFVASTIGIDSYFDTARTASSGALNAWQLLADSSGVTRVFPGNPQNRSTTQCGSYDARTRPWYVAAASGPKDVVLLLDVSGSMLNPVGLSQKTREELLRPAVDAILDTLTQGDFISIVAFSTTATSLKSAPLRATAANIASLKRAWAEYSFGGFTYFALGFTKAFDLLSLGGDSTSGCTRVILFLSDGDPTDGSAYSTVISTGQAALQAKGLSKAHIFAVTMGADIADTVPKAIACDNAGVYENIADGADPLVALRGYYQFLAAGLTESQVRWSNPYTDAFGLGQMVTGAIPVFDRSQGLPLLVGVLGADVTMSELEKYADYNTVVNALLSRSKTCPVMNFTDCNLQQLRELSNSGYVCPSPMPTPDSCRANSDAVTRAQCSRSGSNTLNSYLCSSLDSSTLLESSTSVISITEAECCLAIEGKDYSGECSGAEGRTVLYLALVLVATVLNLTPQMQE